jgi:hypothetical protein
LTEEDDLDMMFISTKEFNMFYNGEDVAKTNDKIFYGFLAFFTVVVGLFGWAIS